jgi:ABC-type multidrug transport system ATPase subunit
LRSSGCQGARALILPKTVHQPPPIPQPESTAPALVFRGQRVERVPLGESLSIGRSEDADLFLSHASISRKHAEIVWSGSDFEVRDLGSRAGSMINGRLFERHRLVFGDLLQLGPFSLRFDGQALVLVAASAGGQIHGIDITRKAGAKTLLHGVSLHIEAGQFIGILGTSGAGKSTLLNTLSGLVEPDRGTVLVNGVDVYGRAAKTMCGYVPQDDIVHSELSVAPALAFSAALRLPGSIPASEIQKLVDQTLHQLRLQERAGLRVSSLSGGQRKRVSIGAELLARPPVLFLDEPSSGLDPATEFKLMELLRQLANTGCTVVCTTHVMENVFLMDKVVVMTGGRLVFMGPPADVLEHFGIQRFSALYDRLEEKPAEEWEAAFAKAALPQPPPAPAVPPAAPLAADPPHYFQILLRRQWALLSSSARNLITLAGQPIVIALLVAWMAAVKPDLKLFIAWLATFWFGCSNAAEDIVGEISIYRRERIVGLGRHQYLMMKFAFFGAITAMQSVIFFIGIHFTDMTGAPFWQFLGLLATGWCGVAMGFAISALVETKTQAVRIVPLILLPQIIFAGFVLELPSGGKRALAEWIPSYSTQRIMDASMLWGENVPELRTKLATRHTAQSIAFRNLNSDGDLTSANGMYDDFAAPVGGLFKLMLWSLAGYGIAFVALRRRERG